MEGFLPLLNLMCFSTAAAYSGSQMRLQRKLELLRQMAAKGLLCVGREEMEDFLSRYAASGCGPVRHSCEYKQAYHPHYRVVREAYNTYLPVLWAAMKLRESAGAEKRPGILAIDGRCGSGKTFLSGLLAEVFHCSVFHLDDFYLPQERRSGRWMTEPAGNIDRERFLREVLIPFRNGEKVLYRPYSCRKRTMLPAVEIPPGRLAVVDGSYSMHPDFRSYYDFRVFLTCLSNVQQRRIFLRGDGKYLANFLEWWIPAEERYFDSMQVSKACNLVLDTSEFNDLS
jgi:uridine kinase